MEDANDGRVQRWAMIQKRIIGIVGVGHVGMAAAYALHLRKKAGELIVVDRDRQRAKNGKGK